MKQMNARYAGVCAYYDLSGCNRTIAVGDTIMWERGSGAWHVNCGPTGVDAHADSEVMQGMADAKTWQFLKGAFGENSRELIEWEISNDPESVGGPFY